MNNNGYAVIAILAMALVTMFLRAIPFIGSKYLKKFAAISRLGRFLPPAIMTILLLHTLYGSSAGHRWGGWLELSAVLMVIVAQVWWRQTLTSIVLGTCWYVLARNFLM